MTLELTYIELFEERIPVLLQFQSLEKSPYSIYMFGRIESRSLKYFLLEG